MNIKLVLFTLLTSFGIGISSSVSQCTAVLGHNAATPLEGCAPLTVQYVDNSSGSGPDAVTGRTWQFGTGDSSNANTPDYTYTVPGTYIVCLTVQCVVGTNTMCDTVVVHPRPTVSYVMDTSGFIDNDTACAFTDSICFINTSDSLPGYSYMWDFGDALSGTDFEPCHIYLDSGTFDVSLTVTTDQGCQSSLSSSNIITIIKPPTPDFVVASSIGCHPFTVSVTNTTTSSFDNWSWNWGDGNFSFVQSPGSHVFTTPGVITITLSAEQAQYGCANSTTNTVVVKETPVADFNRTSPECRNDTTTVSFTGVANGSENYFWNFDDGTVITGSGQGPYDLRFDTAGNKYISLIVEELGCYDTVEKTIVVYNNPIAFLTTSSGSDTICAGDLINVKTIPQGYTSYDYIVNGSSVQSSSINTYSSAFSTGDELKVRVTDVNGCMSFAQDTLSFIAKPLPTSSHTITTDSICYGDSVQIITDPGGYDSYRFIFNNGTIVTQTDSSVYFSPLVSGNISVETSDNGCLDNTPLTPINVMDSFPKPYMNCGPSGNDSVSFIWSSVLNATDYEISTDGGAFVSTSQSNSWSLSGLSASDCHYALLRIPANGLCNGSQVSDTLTCCADPCSPVNFTLSGNNEICTGETVSAAVSGITANDYGISWDGGTSTLTASYTSNPVSNTTISACVTDSSQNSICPATCHLLDVVVNAFPSVSLTVSSDTICENDPVVFTASPLGYDQYDFYRNGVDPVQSTGSEQFISLNWESGDNMIVQATHNSCLGGVSNSVTPIIETQLDPPQPYCGNATQTDIDVLWDDIPGVTEYLVSTDGQNFVTNGLSTSYSFSALNAGELVTLFVQSSGTSPCNLSPMSLPANCIAENCNPVTFNLTPDTSVCSGNQVNIQITNSSTISFSVSWNGNTPGLITDSLVTPLTNQSYSVTLKDSSQLDACPATTKTMTISVDSISALNLSSSVDTTCSGDNICFSVNPTGYDVYTFMVGFNPIQSNGSPVYCTSTWQAGDSIYVNAVNNGCVGTASNVLIPTVESPLNLPQVNCGVTTSNSIQFIWDSIPGASSYEVSIEGGPFVAPDSTFSHNISGLSSGDDIFIQVMAMGSGACGNSQASSPVQCLAIPCSPVSFTLGSNATICEGDSVGLTISNISAADYEVFWNSDSNTIGTSLTYTFLSTTSGNINVPVQVTDTTQTQCPATKNFVITVNPIPVLAISSNAVNDSICDDGGGITFSASPAGLDSYGFYLNGVTLVQSGANHQYVDNSWVNGDSLLVSVTDLGCSSSSGFSSGVVYTSEPLETPILYCGGSTDSSITFLWDPVSGAAGYEISLNGGAFFTPNGGLSHTISGLNSGECRTATVRSVGYGVCGNSLSSLGVQCCALTCDLISYQLIPGGNVSVCEGDLVNLSISNPGLNNYQIIWGNGSPGSDDDTSFVSSSSVNIDVNVVNLDQPLCPGNEKTFVINVSPLPTVTLTGSFSGDTVCPNDQIVFTASPVGYDAYQFFINGFGQIQNSASNIYSASNWSDGDSLSVRATDGGCSGPVSSGVEYSTFETPLSPQINCGNSNSDSVQAVWNDVVIDGDYLVSVDGNTFINPSGVGSTDHWESGLSPGDSVSFQIAVTDNNCGDTVFSSVIQCFAIPCTAVSFSQSGGGLVCEGNSASFSVSGISPTNYTISWNGNQTNLPDYSLTPVSDTSVCVTIIDTDQPACTGMTSCNLVDFVPSPTVTISSSSSDSVCPGELITFSTTPVFYDNYTFYLNSFGLLQSGGNPIYSTLNWDSNDTIMVIAEEDGCVGSVSNAIATFVYEEAETPDINCGITTDSTIEFTWNTPAGISQYELVIVGDTNVNVSLGSYNISGLNAGDCISAYVQSIPSSGCSNSLPSNTQTCCAFNCNPVTFNTNADTSLCFGDSITLSVSNISAANSQIYWDGIPGASSVVFNGTSSQTVIVEVEDLDQPGCPYYFSSVQIDVNGLPVVSSTSTTDSICQTDQHCFKASPSVLDQYDFYSGFALIQSSSNYEFCSSSLQNNDSIYVIPMDNGCSGIPFVFTVPEIIPPLPAPQLNCSTSTLNSVIFIWDDISGSNGYQIDVDDAGQINPSTGLNGLFHEITGLSPNDTVFADVQALGILPCGESLVSNVAECYAQPCTGINFTRPADMMVCSGELINLQITNLTPSDSVSISWEGNITNLTSFSLVASADTVIDITVSPTNEPGCPAVTKSVTISVSSTPLISLSDLTGPFCENSVFCLEAVPSGFDNYVFYNGFQSLQSSANHQFCDNNFSSGDSIYAVATNNGCVGTSSNSVFPVQIQNPQTPVVNCGNSTNDSIEVVWNVDVNASQYMASVDGGAPFVPSGSGSFWVNGLSTGDTVVVTLSAVGFAPCLNTVIGNTVSCIAQPCSAISFDQLSDVTSCLNDTVEFVATGISTTNFALSWNGNTFTNDTSFQLVVSANSTLTVSLYDSLQPLCPTFNQEINVTAVSLPSVNLSTNSDTVCDGDLVIFSSSDFGYDNYDFYNGYFLAQSGPNPEYGSSNWVSGDSIYVLVSSSGCSGLASNAPIVFEQNPLGVPQVNCGNTGVDSLEFFWDAINASTGYVVSVNGSAFVSPSSGSNGLTHVVTGLISPDSLSIDVIALGSGVCGNSNMSITTTCSTLPCTLVDFTRSNDTTVCENETVTLLASGLTTANYSLDWNNGSQTGTGLSYVLSAIADSVISVSLTDLDQPGCPSTEKYITIDVNSLPQPLIDNGTLNDSLCFGLPLSLLAIPASYDNYQFFSGVGVLLQDSVYPIYIPSGITGFNDFYVVATDLGCIGQSAVNSLEVLPLPSIGLTSSLLNDTTCISDTVLFTASPSGLTNYEFYNSGVLLQSSSSELISYTINSGLDSVFVTGTDQFGCYASATTTVEPVIMTPPIATLTASDTDSLLCNKTQVVFTAGPTNMSSYHFLINGYTAFIGDSGYYATDSILGTDTVQVLVTDQYGCSSIADTSVFYTIVPSPVLSVSDTTFVCTGFEVEVEAVFDSLAFPGTVVHWYDQNVVVDSGQTTSLSPSLTSTYQVTGTFGDCISDPVDFTVAVDFTYPLVSTSVLDPVVCIGGSTTVSVTGGKSWLWWPSGEFLDSSLASTTVLSVDSSMYYFVNVMNDACVTLDSVFIEMDLCLTDLPPEWIPQIFTPNSDGKNDYWTIKHVDYFEDNSVIVFNRWGNVVYSSAPYNNDWDGSNMKGSPLPDGTYYYILKLDEDIDPKTGFIIIHK